MIQRPVDATETDKIIAIQIGSDLIKNIIRTGVQTPCEISHPSSVFHAIRGMGNGQREQWVNKHETGKQMA